MRKKFLLVGILLFIGGGLSVYGSYSTFNQFSMADAWYFSAPTQTWRFPDPPLQLSEGDVLTIGIVFWGYGEARMYLVDGAGSQIELQPPGGVYSVETSGSYHVYTVADSAGESYGFDVGLSVNVKQKAPDPFSLVVGVVGILVGAVFVSLAFLYKKKHVEDEEEI
jgi:hypothetical protein